MKVLSEWQTAWIWVRGRVTRHLIQIQAVCIWNYSCAWRAKGKHGEVMLQKSVHTLIETLRAVCMLIEMLQVLIRWLCYNLQCDVQGIYP